MNSVYFKGYGYLDTTDEKLQNALITLRKALKDAGIDFDIDESSLLDNEGVTIDT